MATRKDDPRRNRSHVATRRAQPAHTGRMLWSDWDARLKPGRCTTGAGRTEDGTVHQSSENWHLPSCRRTSRRNEAFGMKFAAQVPEPSQPKGASEAARQRPFRVEPSAGNRWRRKSRKTTARELEPGRQAANGHKVTWVWRCAHVRGARVHEHVRDDSSGTTQRTREPAPAELPAQDHE